MERDPLRFLKGEDLEYYRNIEYLKEMTKQATALMSRSNAVYNNILPDHDVGVEGRGLSTSTERRSQSADAGQCPSCGTCHGAEFCIVRLILDEDLAREPSAFPRSRISSGSVFRRKTLWPKDWMKETFRDDLKSLPKIEPLVLAESTPKEDESNYQMVKARYGEVMGHNFLLAKSIISGYKNKVEKCASQTGIMEKPSSDRKRDTLLDYEMITSDCFSPEEPKLELLCSENAANKDKMASALFLNAPCTSIPQVTPPRWKDIFRQSNVPTEHRERMASIKSTISMDHLHVKKIECPIGTPLFPTGPCPPITEMTQFTEPIPNDATTNFLDTVRQNMKRERMDLLKAESNLLRSGSMSHFTGQIQDLRGSVYQHQLDTFVKCVKGKLHSDMPDDAVEEIEESLDKVAEQLIGRVDIQNQQWHQWYEGYTLGNIESEDQDSLDVSDFDDNQSSLDECDLPSLRQIPRKASRIPFVDETYNFVDVVFDKISAKFEKDAMKNDCTEKMFHLSTENEVFLESVKFRSPENDFYANLHDRLKSPPPYSKSFIPSKLTNENKIDKLNALVKEIISKKRGERQIYEQIQLGEYFPPKKNSLIYTKKGNYLGFSSKKRRFLNKTESAKFRTCDLIGDESGRCVNKKLFRKDFRFVKNFFEPRNKEMKSGSGIKELSNNLKLRSTGRTVSENKTDKRPSKEENVLLKASRNAMSEHFKSPRATLERPNRESSTVRNPSSVGVPNRTSLDTMHPTSIGNFLGKTLPALSHDEEKISLFAQSISMDPGPLGTKLAHQESSLVNPKMESLATETASSSKIRTSQMYERQSSRRSKLTDWLQEQSLVANQESKRSSRMQNMQNTSVQTVEQQSTIRDSSLASHTSSYHSERANSKPKVRESVEAINSKLNFSSDSRIGDATKNRNSSRNDFHNFDLSDSHQVRDSIKNDSKVSSVWSEKPGHISVSKAKDNSKSMVSAISVGSTGRSRSKIRSKQLGPTKIVSFGIDIGQGLNYIRYLKENAKTADEEKKQELLQLLTVRTEKKKKPAIFRELSKTLSSNRLETASEVSQTCSTVSQKNSTTDDENKRYYASYEESRDDKLDGTQTVKTLDEIYREMHGINLRNTPEQTIDRSYENRRAQQLRKHRQDWPFYSY